MIKFVIIVALGILANGEEGDVPDNYVQKIVRSAQDSAPSQAGNGIVSISKSLILSKTSSTNWLHFYLCVHYYFLLLLINYLKSKEIHNNLNPNHFFKTFKTKLRKLLLTVPFLTYCRDQKLAKLPRPLAMDWFLERRPLVMDWSLERSPSGPGAKIFCTKEPACLRRYPNFLEGRNKDLCFCLECQLKEIKNFFKTI